MAAVRRQPARSAVSPPPPINTPHYGIYSCSQLEQLWISQGGNPGEAYTAAEIAKAESGGSTGAISPTSDYGLWQINMSNFTQASSAYLNPVVNARAAIAISHDGSDWYPWTTYTSGAYHGRC